jgi:hypothetical protein
MRCSDFPQRKEPCAATATARLGKSYEISKKALHERKHANLEAGHKNGLEHF